MFKASFRQQEPLSATGTRMTNPRQVVVIRLAWILGCAWAVGMFLLSLPAEYVIFRDAPEWAVGFQAVLDDIGLSRDFFAAYVAILDIINVVAPTLLGLLIFRQRGNDWLALLLSAATVIYGAGNTLAFYLTSPMLASLSRTLMDGFIVLILSLFPDGRLFPRWTRWLVIAVFALALFDFAALHLPLPFTLGGLIGYPLVILALSLRYRQPGLPAIQQQQIKWVLWGFIIAFLAYSIYSVIPLIFPSLASIHSQNPVYTLPSLLTFLITVALRLFSGVFFVAALSISIVRYRLWDVDLTINRSLVTALVTVLLAIIFGGVFVLLNELLQALFGAENAALAGAAAAAVSLGLFNPVRHRVRKFVDRNIYGFRFDLDALNRAQEPPPVRNPGALTGRTLDTFTILDVLGKGGMGEVYKGYTDGQTVAIKILSAALADQPEFKARFEREAQTLATLDHPYIVRLHGYGSAGGLLYMAMDFIDGRDLSALVREMGALPPENVVQILAKLASALDYAHQQGFVHRDIKPSNVMLRTGGSHDAWDAVLMDFGVAKISSVNTRFTGTGAIGTIDYMAPEQIMSAREVDHRADIYALGVLVYELLTGRRPFEGNPAQVLFAHIQQPAPDPGTMNPAIHRDAAHAILRALHKNADDRWASAGDFAAALASSLGG